MLQYNLEEKHKILPMRMLWYIFTDSPDPLDLQLYLFHLPFHCLKLQHTRMWSCLVRSFPRVPVREIFKWHLFSLVSLTSCCCAGLILCICFTCLAISHNEAHIFCKPWPETQRDLTSEPLLTTELPSSRNLLYMTTMDITFYK